MKKLELYIVIVMMVGTFVFASSCRKLEGPKTKGPARAKEQAGTVNPSGGEATKILPSDSARLQEQASDTNNTEAGMANAQTSGSVSNTQAGKEYSAQKDPEEEPEPFVRRLPVTEFPELFYTSSDEVLSVMEPNEAERAAIEVIETLKKRTVNDYGLGREEAAAWKMGYDEFDMKLNDLKPIYRDSRACKVAIYLLAKVKSKKALPVLEEIFSQNRRWWHICFAYDAENAIKKFVGTISYDPRLDEYEGKHIVGLSEKLLYIEFLKRNAANIGEYTSDMEMYLRDLWERGGNASHYWAIMKILKESEYPEIRAYAAEHLENKVPPYPEDKALKEVRGEIVSGLKEALTDEDVRVRAQAAGSLLSHGEGDIALPVLEKIIMSDTPEADRALSKLFAYEKSRYSDAIVITWTKLWDARGKDLLRKALNAPNEDVRRSAAGLLEDVNKRDELEGR